MGKNNVTQNGTIVNRDGMPVGYTRKAKREHYNAVAQGKKDVKSDSKFSTQEQRVYAKGQADARNEIAAAEAYRNGNKETRKKIREEQKAFRQRMKDKKNGGGNFGNGNYSYSNYFEQY